MAAPVFNVFVGAETGLLKGVNVDKKTCQNLNNIQEVSRDKEISTMCYSNQEETKISIGLKNQQVLEYNCDSGEIITVLDCQGGDGPIKGLCKYDDCYVTCVESGLVKVWREKQEDCTELQVGDKVCRMRQNPCQPSLVATGGKENDLKIWDLKNDGQSPFKAKNVPHDWLNLRVPVWILDLAILPDSQKVVTCTGHHQVRLYDPMAQKRPVLDMTFDENPITTLSLTPSGNQVIVGNSIGNMALLDLRTGRMVQTYKGFSGGIRCVQCHPTLPIVASCGLDRFLRIHDVDTKELLHKFYLKSRLNCLLMASDWDSVSKHGADQVEAEVRQSEAAEEEEETDALWDTLDVVGKKKSKVKRQVPATETPRRSKRCKKRSE